MDVRSFNRKKMQWLNAVSLEWEVSATAFRVAYVIADHQNLVAGFAWPLGLGSLGKSAYRPDQFKERSSTRETGMADSRPTKGTLEPVSNELAARTGTPSPHTKEAGEEDKIVP